MHRLIGAYAITHSTEMSVGDGLRVVSVGWLDPGEPYRQGAVSEAFVDQPMALLG